MRSKAVLDTNFLLIPSKFKVDIFAELKAFGNPQLFVPDSVLKELEKIARKSGRDSRHARVALKLAGKLRVLKSKEKQVDKELVRLGKLGYTVCTLDRRLIKELRKEGADVISLRQKKRLYRLSESF
ncbi:MAG: DNA-binding protein [Candidatus Aenigmatarchaeota archaeon]|nr:MAG: DNA-binding protein [Candidatus Aenigmarchaeota archaeon]